MKNNSIWLEDLNLSNQNKLTKNLEIDILIIGGGITGLSAAYHLKDSNKKICLVERNQVGHGVTSKTTGKLTFLQETTYTTLKNLISEENSKKYLKSQQDAIKLVENIITKNNIDCNYQKVPSYVFTNNQKDIPKIKKKKSY